VSCTLDRLLVTFENALLQAACLSAHRDGVNADVPPPTRCKSAVRSAAIGRVDAAS